MKKYFISSLLAFSILPAFALNEQVQNANNYIDALSNETQKMSGIENLDPYHQIKRDLVVGKQYNEIKMLQKQWGMEETGIFTKELQEFVKEAQLKKGLNPTGVIDLNTWFILYNQPISWREAEVKKAVDSWNKIIEKDALKKNSKMIIVNIPSMMLYVYDKDENGQYKKALSMRAVIGSKSHQTPYTDLNIVSLKYNPTWTPTNNIVKRSAFDKNGNVKLNWLENNHITIYNKEHEVVPHEDLEFYDYRELKFIQPAGDGNSLGLLKFETNSKDNIYLHDTNAKKYFGHNVRAYSSGCIRVEDYAALASYILGKDKEYIAKQLSKEKTFWEKTEITPVYFDNSRVHFDNDGTPHFFASMY